MNYRARGIAILFLLAVLVIGAMLYSRSGDEPTSPPAAELPPPAVIAPAPVTPEIAPPPPSPATPPVESAPLPEVAFGIHGVVYEPSGAPAAGAIIRYAWGPDPRRGITAEGEPPAGQEVVSDDRGVFHLASLAEGQALLRAEHATGRAIERIRMGSHEPVVSTVIVLEAGATLGGVVVARDGAPVAGARVAPVAPADGEALFPHESALLAVETDEGGRFLLEGLASGSWTLLATAAGHGPTESGPFDTGTDTARIVMASSLTLPCIVRDGKTNTPVAGVSLRLNHATLESLEYTATSGADGTVAFAELGPGDYRLDVADRRFALAGAPLEVSLAAERGAEAVMVLVEAGGEVRGRVTRADSGAGVAGVRLEAWQEGRELVFSPPSDGEGRYAITGLPSGTYRVRAPRTLPGFARDPATRPEQTVIVTAGAALDGVDFALSSGAALAGTVVDGAGNPVAAATVHGRNTEGIKKFAAAVTDESGRFSFADYDEGEAVELGASTPFGKSGLAGPYVAGAPGSDAIVLTLAASCEQVIAGRVTDASGRPFRCKLLALTDDPALQFPSVPPTGQTDGEGNFVLTGACPATYQLVMVPDTDVRQEFGPVVVSPGQSVTGLHLTYDQGELLELSGTVVDEEGAPIAGAEIRAGALVDSHVTSSMMTSSDENGAFRFDALPEGEYDVRAMQEGYLHGGSVKASAGSTDVVLELRRGPMISGQVRDSAGKPITAFTVRLLPAGGAEGLRRETTTSNPEGRFAVSAPNRGEWTLQVEAAGYENVAVELGVIGAGDRLEDLEVVLRKGEGLKMGHLMWECYPSFGHIPAGALGLVRSLGEPYYSEF